MISDRKHPLYGCSLKIKRAGDQLNALRSEMKEFVESDFYELCRRYDPDTKIAFDALCFKKEFPPMWSAQVGEIVHNLRSALDYVVYQMIIRETGAAPTSNKVCFPIFDTEQGYKSRHNDMLFGLKDAARAFIRAEQPFLSEKPRFCPIWHLAQLNNWDKHRSISVAILCSRKVSSKATIGSGVNGVVVFPPGLLKDNAPLFGTMIPDGPESIEERAAKVQVQGNATLEIAIFS